MFSADVLIKRKKNAVFEITQMECRWRKRIRDCIPAGMLHDVCAQIPGGSARQATQGRGGFNRYRASRRAWSTGPGAAVGRFGGTRDQLRLDCRT